VDILRETARYYSLPVLDLFAVSGIQPEVETSRQTYMPDGVHPNDAGHRLLAELMAAFLRAL
jgi:lysophospholipase L1-like esterase